MMRLKKSLALLATWCLLAALSLPASVSIASAQQNGLTISMDFDKVDIRVFIKFISELTGKNFVIDDRIRGRVTILSPRRISVEEAYRVFESVLEVNDFIAVPSGEVTKIVLAKGAKTMALSTSGSKARASSPTDTMVTQIIPLTYASSTEVKKLLAPMVSPNGLLTDYAASDTMIITDYLSNISRLMKIIEAIDVKDKDKNLRIITLNYASASKLARTSPRSSSPRSPPKARRPRVRVVRSEKAFAIVPDDRINALVIVADTAQIEQIETLVAELDPPAPKEHGNIQVYYLEDAEAEEMEKTLMSLVGKKVAGPAGKDGQQKEAIISEGTKIVADKSTNSLVINADPGGLPDA
jgi:general secretion pathway protein D